MSRESARTELEPLESRLAYSDIAHGCTRILALAPHPDDEVFGCGGLLYRLRNTDHVSVKVVFFSDGAKGTPESAPSQQLSERRRTEACQVLSNMNIEEHRFLQLPDGFLLQHIKVMAEAISSELGSHAPEAVLFPHRGDRHPDHLAVTQASLRACRGTETPFLIGYEVWNRIRDPNLYLPLSAEDYATLQGLSRQYESQHQLFNYDAMLFRSRSSRGAEIGMEFAEAYHVVEHGLHHPQR